MVHKYALVNPIIVGSLNTIVEADNSALAAKEIYNKISPFFSNAQSKMIFTIQKLSSKKNKTQLGGSDAVYYNFKVKEVPKENKEVVFTISTHSGKVDYSHLGNSIKHVLGKLEKKTDIDQTEDGSNLSGGAKNESKKERHDSESESFDRLLEELDDEESVMFPRNRSTKSIPPPYINPYVNPYFPSFFTPTLVDPISYYWYSDIYLDTPRVYFPSFIPSISPRIILDRSPVITVSKPATVTVDLDFS